MEIQEIERKRESAYRKRVSVPLPDWWQSASFMALREIMNPVAGNKI
jgi:hypothetical protein